MGRPTWSGGGIVSESDPTAVKRDGSTALTANWDVGAFTVRALRFYADQATGTSPFQVDSTTVVTNLNADTVDGVEAAAMLRVNGSLALSANWDAGAFQIRALTLYADATTGTIPIVVDSTTMCTNLNADTVDGIQGNAIALLAGATFTGPVWVGGNIGGDVGLGLVSTDKAFKVSVLTDTQRDALTIEAGMVILNSDSTRLEYHDGIEWRLVAVV